MPEESFQERTEQATPRRRQEAREKGNVAKSREIPSVFVLLISLLVFHFTGQWMLREFFGFMRFFFGHASEFTLSQLGTQRLFFMVMRFVVTVLFPILVGVVSAALLGNFLQIGFLWTSEPLMPKFDRLDPIKGFKRLFSIQAFAELMRSILKILIVGYVAYLTVKHRYSQLPGLVVISVADILKFSLTVSFDILYRTCWVLVILAILDYGFQRWQYEKDLRMSKQEVKDEFKQREGDPLIKARIRKMQREIARRRMMEAVPKADVVITNPTHLAVALRYKREEKMRAPKVVAKGAGFLADKIREMARKHSVPLVENKPLAQTLYKGVEIGEEIPEALYKAVAEVLAYVYKLKHPERWKREQHGLEGSSVMEMGG